MTLCLGSKVWCLELNSGEMEAAEDEAYQPDTEQHTISGGSGMMFERDGNPPNPSGEEPWVDKFGFQ